MSKPPINNRDLPDPDDEVVEAQAEQENKIPHASYEELLAKLNETEVRLNEVEAKLADEKDKALRSHAELQNIKRSAAQDIQKAHKFANESLVNELLPILDSLERGLETNVAAEVAQIQAMREGIELTLKMFQSVLEKAGVKKINPHGEAFDPAFHQAMAMQESSDMEAGKVLQVLQHGYQLNERLIRPALVIVAKSAET